MSREVDSDDDRLEIAEEPPSTAPPSQAMALVKGTSQVVSALATTQHQPASTINFKLKRDPWQQHHTLPAVREVLFLLATK